MKLIDKEKVVEEVEKLYKENYKFLPSDINESVEEFKDDLLRVLDTLSTVKEVDLDNELDFVKDAYYYFTSDERSSMKKVARHFFELGLNARKGE